MVGFQTTTICLLDLKKLKTKIVEHTKPEKASKTIQSHAYDADNGKMQIRFHNNALWEHDCDEETYDEFCNSESLGKFYHSTIKKFEGRQIIETDESDDE